MWTRCNGDIGLAIVKVTCVDRFCVYRGSCATRHTPHSLVAWVALGALVALEALGPLLAL